MISCHTIYICWGCAAKEEMDADVTFQLLFPPLLFPPPCEVEKSLFLGRSFSKRDDQMADEMSGSSRRMLLAVLTKLIFKLDAVV